MSSPKRASGLLLILGAALLLAYCAFFSYHHARRGWGDFTRWRTRIQALAEGHDVYRGYHDPAGAPGPRADLPCAPTIALLLYPLTLLSKSQAGLTFCLLKAALAAVAIGWALRLERAAGPPLPGRALAWAMAIALPFVFADLTYANINLLVMLLAYWGIRSFCAGRDRQAGLLLGAATAAKVTPLLFLPYLLFKRQWLAAAWFAAGLLIATFAPPAIALGPESAWKLVSGWYQVTIEPYLRGEMSEYTYHTNQSIAALMYRLLSESPGIWLIDSGASDSFLFVNIASLDSASLSWLVRAVLCLILGAVGWIVASPLPDRRDPRWLIEMSMILVCMLLFSERTWPANLALLVLPCLVLARPERGWLADKLSAMAIAFVLLSLPAHFVDEFPVWEMIDLTLRAYGSHTILMLGLLAALMRERQRLDAVLFRARSGLSEP